MFTRRHISGCQYSVVAEEHGRLDGRPPVASGTPSHISPRDEYSARRRALRSEHFAAIVILTASQRRSLSRRSDIVRSAITRDERFLLSAGAKLSSDDDIRARAMPAAALFRYADRHAPLSRGFRPRRQPASQRAAGIMPSRALWLFDDSGAIISGQRASLRSSYRHRGYAAVACAPENTS